MSVPKQAFPGRRGTVFYLAPEDVVLVGLDTDDGEDHPQYDARVHWPVDESMARDVALNGVLEPIVVRKVSGKALVVLGRQRVKAARRANEILAARGRDPVAVPCILFRPVARTELLGVQISENEHRRGNSPLDRARLAERLRRMGASDEEIEVRFGVTGQTLANWGRLLETSLSVQEAVDVGQISSTAAAKLVKLPEPEQDSALATLVEEAKEGGGRGKGQPRVSTRAAEGAVCGTSSLAGPPGKRVLRRLIDENETFVGSPDTDELIRGILRWCAGDGKPPREIRAAVRRSSTPKGKRRPSGSA